jgi:DNA-binding MarR family transcriptional regulator
LQGEGPHFEQTSDGAGLGGSHHSHQSDQGQEDLFQLLRYSHIFSTLVQEILEIKYLRETTPLPLTLSQLHLLKLISLNGQHQVGEIAYFLGVSSPAATKNIDKLEGLGLVTRSPSQGDRRATLLGSSPKGRNLVKRYEALKQSRLGPILEHFSDSELKEFTRLLEKFSLVLMKSEDEGEGLCLRCSAYFDQHCPVRVLRDGCPYQKVIGSNTNRLEKSDLGAAIARGPT